MKIPIYGIGIGNIFLENTNPVYKDVVSNDINIPSTVKKEISIQKNNKQSSAQSSSHVSANTSTQLY